MSLQLTMAPGVNLNVRRSNRFFQEPVFFILLFCELCSKDLFALLQPLHASHPTNLLGEGNKGTTPQNQTPHTLDASCCMVDGTTELLHSFDTLVPTSFEIHQTLASPPVTLQD